MRLTPKVLAWAIAAISIATWGYLVAQRQASSAQSHNASLIRHVAEAASLANQSVPMMLDAESELFSVMAVGTTLNYNVRLVSLQPAHASQAELQQVIDEEMKPSGTRSVCSHPDSGKTIQSGATFTYTFYYADQTYGGRYEITPEDCRRVQRRGR